MGWRTAARLALLALFELVAITAIVALLLWFVKPPAPAPDPDLIRTHQLFGGWTWPAVWIHEQPRVVLVVT